MSPSPTRPRWLHVVGRKNHGKTTLVLELIEALTTRGLRVGSVKHTSHAHDLDTPGKDSHRHRLAGAAPAAMVTAHVTGVFLPGLDPAHPYETLAPMYARCDVVLVEGHLDGPGPKVEVWRADAGTAPLAATRDDIHATISDDSPEVPVPIWPRRDLPALIEHLARTGLVPPAPRAHPTTDGCVPDRDLG